MTNHSRRNFLKGAATATALSALPLTAKATTGLNGKNVIVIGGGFAGATAAKYIRHWSDANVTLIEPNVEYNSCILSGLVVTGERTLDQVSFDYNTLQSKYGVNVIADTVNSIDSGNQTVTRSGSATPLPYDKLVLAPGIEFIDPGLTGGAGQFSNFEVLQNECPHAWKAGAQTTELKNQVDALQQAGSGTLVIRVPKKPFRCPPGPYERACTIADYLGPNFDVKIVDPDDSLNTIGVLTNVFAGLFGSGNLYPNIEHIAGEDVTNITSGKVVTVSNYGDIAAQVVNFIPDQRAPAIVRDTVGGTWGAVDPVSYESTTTANIHIIGDSQATSQPKAGHIANSEAKVCADAIVRSLMPAPMLPYAYPMTNSACFTPINSNEAAWISAVYKYDGSAIVTEKVGNSPTYNEENHEVMFDWANNLFSDTFG
ncbi:FAD-dependent oxidoreductase [Solemya velum gill symbiont]|uniref:FAD-dependent oxidoreductase n=1 Tax=Solemya velum gill symbiont TaxID=2340 RepID=UPI000997282E|nr:FAD/NAD(P)-binding oxidoreductase [Solemya velum gill symbiont]OOZ46423.1 hypothetical protein BOW37_00780 [Solemya velum gill symbiont]OOZ47247.1 hypothetical protein BOW38_04125 [Solemya velum gill symbiont]OOZ52349.1 hypothetical protein BOW40_03450 [Solemya velum gill symbiont]OOZ55230.1 hypothetical protein BOW41_04155 [Solemya velum gill symbiont]OOZ57384.1 hypothetical protein BOW42_03735 [Solemya velum gill symbiont]